VRQFLKENPQIADDIHQKIRNEVFGTAEAVSEEKDSKKADKKVSGSKDALA
jgi:hypothetical protein